VEKEGFAPLLKATRIAERFDIGIMSTKGMSTTAARMLLDNLVDRGVRKVLVLHDFDVAGFSIFGTLAADGRRYRYLNDVPIFDIGLRLTDVVAMGLQSEPIAGDTFRTRIKKADTLKRHGATAEEIAFLNGETIPARGQRVELNAMTSREFIDFLEQKFEEHGVEKVIPDNAVLIQHARRVLGGILAEKALEEIKEQITNKAVAFDLPDDLRQLVERKLQAEPSMSWDIAITKVVEQLNEGGAP
jgi:hypothetical protein